MSNPTPAVEVKKGLEGVIVDECAVSKVMPETNSLTYRGYAVQDLADKCSFEEVAYLLWHGELPKKSELETFTKRERALRPISKGLGDSIRLYPKSAHPMDTVRTGVSYLGMEECSKDEESWSPKDAFKVPAGAKLSNYDKAISLLAKIPSSRSLQNLNSQCPRTSSTCVLAKSLTKTSSKLSTLRSHSTPSMDSTLQHLPRVLSRRRCRISTQRLLRASALSKARFTAAPMSRSCTC